MSSCLICERVLMSHERRNPFLIAEMEHTVFVVGDHQFHEGYSLVLLKNHLRELHDLPPDVQLEHFSEVMRATSAVRATYSPWKLNHACYGNSEPHVHWHIIPRYEHGFTRTGSVSE